jgi:hypothetical protein
MSLEEIMDYTLLRGVDEGYPDSEEMIDFEKRNELIGRILEVRPEVSLFNMIVKYGDLEEPNPGLEILGARIGGLMKVLSEMTLTELEACTNQ